jgi:biotin-(acetyl-CoA carboxylase) ligase
VPYDRTQNPRDLSGETEPREQDPDRIEFLEQRIRSWREALETFATPGWAHIAATVANDAEALTKRLVFDQDGDIAAVSNLRGRIQALNTVLLLPENFRQQIEDDSGELAELTSPEQGAEEESFEGLAIP